MARRIITQPAGSTPDEKVEDKPEVEEAGAMPGGELGVREPEPAAIAKPAHKPNPVPVDPPKPPVPVKTYRVTAPRQVLYGGVPTMLRAGKIVTDATHDLHSLRAQGVHLEEIPHRS